ncbi:hypothetical protein [Staphylococcus aureus]|uniref:hypothetical protein n=1 Tax=Staphylococcus aureus TaxID=1280 RepID=UPI001C10495D|nr:hypothetical protein [Staphylococcus aureus]
MEFKLLDVEGKSIVNVKRINVHAYYLKGIEDTHLDHLKIRINPSELNSFKSKYKSSPDSCVKCYTMFLPFLLIKIDVFS